MLLEFIKIFFIGILEDFLLSYNTKTVQRNNQLFGFGVSFISAILWYYVIIIVVENINKFWLVLTYATGGGFGDIMTMRFDRHIQEFEKRIENFFRRIKLRWPIEFIPRNEHRKKKPRKKNGK